MLHAKKFWHQNSTREPRLPDRHYTNRSGLDPVTRLENPPDYRQADCQKQGDHRRAQADANIGDINNLLRPNVPLSLVGSGFSS